MNGGIFFSEIVGKLIDLQNINQKSKIGERMNEEFLLKSVILEEDDRITNISDFQPSGKYIMKGADEKKFPGVRWLVTFNEPSQSPDQIMCTITRCIVDRSFRHLAHIRRDNCILTLNKSNLTSFSGFVFYDFEKIRKKYNAFVEKYNDIVQGIIDATPGSKYLRDVGLEFSERNLIQEKDKKYPLPSVIPHVNSSNRFTSSRSIKMQDPLPKINSRKKGGGKKYRHHFVKTKKRRINRGKTRAKRQNRLHR